MKKFFKIFSLTIISLFFVSYFVAPANAGAPECFLSNPKTCSTYDYVSESKNADGQTCKTRYWSTGVTQSSEGLGCVGDIAKKEEPVLVEQPKVPSSSVVNQPTTNTNTSVPTDIVSIPSNTTNPVIVGDKNNVSSSNSSSNKTNSTVVNTTNNSYITNNVSNVSSVRSEYRTISVNGGVLVIGENGFAKFFPTENETNSLTEENPNKKEIVYLEKHDLPKQIARSINRLPESLSSKKSLRLPASLKNAESVTEDICLIENERLIGISKGSCVLEIPVGNGIYEHEINIIK